jgi:catechol 2,3-dioxygenase-like lactoylglutathione lyase family enzyme
MSFMIRRLVRVALLLATVAAPAIAPAQAPTLAARTPSSNVASRAVVLAVGPVGMTVSDMDRAIDFYSTVLSFAKVSDVEIAGDTYEQLVGVFGARVRVVRMRLGDETIELTEFLAPRGRPIPADSRSQDGWFQHIAIIVSDMDRAYAYLRRHKVEHASSGPQRLPDWNPNAGGIEAFYFKDPDGHTLEILEFPAGKGLAKWQKRTPNAALFLGIDHTAIVTRDTDASLAFYRDLLGLTIAGESENYGTEQEHLNNVFGARLRITALRAATGPGIELLEYLTPRDGRPFPVDARANDLLHWQTTLVTASPDGVASAMRRAGVPFVSPDIITLSNTPLGLARGFLVRDPDGHAMQLVQTR